MIDFTTGALLGGLVLSAGWGAVWLIIGAIGFARGVCGVRVVRNSFAAAAVPALLAVWASRMRQDIASFGPAFAAGLLMMPLVVISLALRRAPDGRRVGLHMADGIRRLKDELLGAHRGCAGCDHSHNTDEEGGCT